MKMNIDEIVDKIDIETIDKKELEKMSKPELISIIIELQGDLKVCRLDSAELG